MNAAPEIVSDEKPRVGGTDARARRYTRGLTDGLGERVILFDPETASSFELLRFRREFTDTPGFEAALRLSVDDLARFHHPSFADVSSVEHLGVGEGIALVSHHVSGRRLSDILAQARGPVFAREFIQQLTPALAALHDFVPAVAHGVLTSERIAVTREGRLIVLEHVLGAAVAALHLPARRLRADLGIAVVPTDPREICRRADVVQLGLIALSLLLGRRVDAADYPVNTVPLLDVAIGSDPASLRLRPWLERALQVAQPSFTCAQEALAALKDIPEEPREATSKPQFALMSLRSAVRPFAAASLDASPAVDDSDASMERGFAAMALAMPPSPMPSAPVAATVGASRTMNADRYEEEEEEQQEEPAPIAASRGSRWTTVGLAVISLAEAAVIALLVYAWPSTGVGTVAIAAPNTAPAAATVPAQSPALSLQAAGPAAGAPAAGAVPAPTTATAPVEAPKTDTLAADRDAASGPRFGGISISSPIEVQVFQGGRLVGSTPGGQIALGEGSQVLDLVNESLGFRSRMTVDVKAGQLTSVRVTIPNGRLSINATPWASVTLDGQPIGDTPLANLSVPIGTHEIIFRNPEFGEQKQVIAVKTEGLTRVGASFRR